MIQNQIESLVIQIELLETENKRTRERAERLEQRIAQLEQRDRGETIAAPSYFEVNDAVSKILAFSRQLFGDSVDVEEVEDLDMPGKRHFRITAQVAERDIDKTLAGDKAWHIRVAALPPAMSGLFRLSFNPQ
jgi:phage shock protein A